MRARLVVGTVLGIVLLLGGSSVVTWAEGELLTDPCDNPAAMQERAKAEWEQTLKARKEFAEQVGLTEKDLRAMMWAKMQRAKLVEALRRQAQELAIALKTPEADGELIEAKVKAYVQQRDETQAQLRQVEQWLMQETDAKNRPKVLGALMVSGALDNGIVSLCPVKSALAGGASNAVKPPQIGPGAGLEQLRLGRRPFGAPRGQTQ